MNINQLFTRAQELYQELTSQSQSETTNESVYIQALLTKPIVKKCRMITSNIPFFKASYMCMRRAITDAM